MSEQNVQTRPLQRKRVEAKEFSIDGLVEAMVQDEKDSFLRS